MVYMFNKYISPKKTIPHGLSNIFGIGIKKALQICHALCINPQNRMYMIENRDLSEIRKYITEKKNWKNLPSGTNNVGSFLQKEWDNHIKKHMKIKNYKGIRHQLGLPVRGQRTHTNAKTQKKRGGSLSKRSSSGSMGRKS